MTWMDQHMVPSGLVDRCMKLVHSLHFSGLHDEVQNIRLVITEDEVRRYLTQPHSYGYGDQPTVPEPGKLWAIVCGVEVWVKERES